MNKSITTIYLKFEDKHKHNHKCVIKSEISNEHVQYDVYECWYKIKIIENIIKILNEEIENFLEKFYKIDTHYFQRITKRKRRYISKDKYELYPPDKNEVFINKQSFQCNGYWIGKNIGERDIIIYISEMCEACGINFVYTNKIAI